MKKARSSEAGDISGGASNGVLPDPTVFACAFKKQRFYLFSQVRRRRGAALRRAACGPSLRVPARLASSLQLCLSLAPLPPSLAV